MTALKVIGKQTIGKYEFTGIEGGFGEDKKAMLVKDIAEIHGKQTKHINEAINKNIKRFKNGIDVIDILGVDEIDPKVFGYTQQAINSYKGLKYKGTNAGIYLLSERGYAKLLKILEDDTAWEIYDQLVDNYFNMRQSIKQGTTEYLKQKRLEIMEENAKTRRAGLLFKSAMHTNSETAKEQILSDVIYELTGKKVIPIQKEKEYSAGDIGNQLGISANKVGRICNTLGLKADQPGQNQFGRWANSKSQYSSKEIPQWLYFENGVRAIKNYLDGGQANEEL